MPVPCMAGTMIQQVFRVRCTARRRLRLPPSQAQRSCSSTERSTRKGPARFHSTPRPAGRRHSRPGPPMRQRRDRRPWPQHPSAWRCKRAGWPALPPEPARSGGSGRAAPAGSVPPAGQTMRRKLRLSAGAQCGRRRCLRGFPGPT